MLKSMRFKIFGLMLLILLIFSAVFSLAQQDTLKQTVAMSAVEYTRKWEPFLGHRQILFNDKEHEKLYEMYQSFHENNNVIITGSVVRISHTASAPKKFLRDVSHIYIEGIDSTNEYGFKCNVCLTVSGYNVDYPILGSIPQEQIQSVQVGDIVSISYENALFGKFEGKNFCVNHKDWDNQKSRIDVSLHKKIHEHVMETADNSSHPKSWWKENMPDEKPKIYRISEYKPIPYDQIMVTIIQMELAQKI